MKKTWKERRIFTNSEQIALIQPDETMTSVVLSIQEVNSEHETRLYLSAHEAKDLATELLSFVADNCA